jgi:type I restriction enzyme S subunit
LRTSPLASPPLREQTRIIRKIDELLSHLNVAREHLSRVPAILKRFRQAVLAAACSGKLTADWRDKRGDVVGPPPRVPEDEIWPNLPEYWGSLSVETACSDVVDCPHSTPKWTSAGVVCLRTTTFKPGVLDLHEVRFVSESTYKERVSRLEPRAGDVLYSREGGILGIACIVPPDVRLCLGQRMMLMRTNPKLCDPAFLMYVLNSPTILAQVRDLTGGSSSPHLNVADIKAFPMPIPSLEEQREIVSRVAALFSLIVTIERRAAVATRLADKLTQSILAKAFRGELVPTEAELARREGREYEPASVLLERIRAERANLTKPTPPAPKRKMRKASAYV